MEEYWKVMRRLLGSRPLILAGANIIILDGNNQVLLHLRSDIHMWGLPGGFCELGESVEETAIREAKEELGITCTNLKLFNVYSGEEFHFTYPNGDEVYNVTVSFICRDYTGDINVNPEEGRDARFFSVEHLPPNIPRGIRRILDDLRTYLEQLS